MQSPSDKDAGAAAMAPGLRVLVVSSDGVTRTLASRMLERLGHRAMPVAALPAAAERAWRCDAALLDTAAVPATGLPDLPAEQGRPDLILLLAPGAAAPAIPAYARLDKPLNLTALAAALADIAARQARSAADPASWDELLRMFSTSGLGEMLAALQRDLPQQTERLQAACRDADIGGIRHVAHALRGVALQFGAPQFVALCAKLEQDSVDGAPLPPLEAASAQMIDAYRRLIRHLDHRLDAY